MTKQEIINNLDLLFSKKEVIEIINKINTSYHTMSFKERKKLLFEFSEIASEVLESYAYTYVNDDTAAENALIYGTADFLEITATAAAASITFEDLVFGTDYIFRVIGYDKDGKVTHMAKAEVTPTVGKVVQYSDSRWKNAMPSVSAAKSGTSMRLTVSFPKAYKQYVVAKVSSEEYVASYPGAARQRTDFVLSHGTAITFEDDINKYNPGWYVSADLPYILVAWQDEENGWYEPVVIDSTNGSVLNK